MVNINETEFKELKGQKAAFPVVLEVNCDELTPISIFYCLEGENKFLLESAQRGVEWGRYSFMGANPYMHVKSYGQDISIEKEGKVENTQGMILEYMEDIMKSPYRQNGRELPFTGGAVGYAGYDIVRQYESLPDKNEDEINIPEAYFMFYKIIYCYDHLRHTLSAIYNVFPLDEASYDEVTKQLEMAIEKVNIQGEVHHMAAESEKKEVKSNFTEEEFCSIVKKAKEHIVKGDIFQAVLSQRLTAKSHSHPFDVYRRLRSKNPSPYLFYIDFTEFQVVGSSPESLVSVKGDTVTTNPIAGTRPRGKTAQEDMKLKEELLRDEKERAEHLMLVDLGRNDIGKVSTLGSVRLDKFMDVDLYSHVMHIVTKVSGELHDNMSCFDALKACLPAGTVSGAPKVRAMEIIDDLENIRRGLYAGAVGYFSYDGNMDMCIAIRTIIFKEDTAYLQAGAGIVYDSDPSYEYVETLNKVMILKEAL
ncbi:anthranilate synthase component 1 [Oxobacter pfennigii]|uniref:Anthranilate synthase component 1 n=1 Tax=Oxobacter pfennigii TaxID=36849 RepID=A0A0P8W724_9CLOT|nr:anthranilate synthase component I [Oxobacter pfennigii]KPU43593.1 anthranilate synthase component 1 [Oxobacter pfennigii]